MRFNISCVFILVSILSINSALADSEFGRLFTTPQQRAMLDSLRKKIVLDTNFVNQNPVESTTVSSASSDIELSGYILRDDGSAMVWINGRSELSGLNTRQVKTTRPRANQPQVTVSTQGKARSLKPGQVWLLDNNRVEEMYKTDPTITAQSVEVPEAESNADSRPDE